MACGCLSRTSFQLLHIVGVVLGLAAESHVASKEKEHVLKNKTEKNQIDEMQREKNVTNLAGSYSRRNKLM